MVSNRLSSIRRKTGNPKVCYPPPPETPPPSTPPPPPPPVWPPPYINAKLEIASPRDNITYSFTLNPTNSDYPINYENYSDDGYAFASCQLEQSGTTYRLNPYTTYTYGNDYYMTYNGPITDVAQTGFTVVVNTWRLQYPADATIQLTLAYPGGA